MIHQSWAYITAWLQTYAPKVFDTIQAGATDEEIHDTEKSLGVRFPDDMRTSYRLCNGQTPDDRGQILGLINGWELLSLERIKEEWNIWKSLVDKGHLAAKNWWYPTWIPLTHSGSGDHHCIDGTYPSNKHYGRIILVWHDMSERPILASSFSEWLIAFTSDLKANVYVYSQDYGGIVKKSEIQ